MALLPKCARCCCGPFLVKVALFRVFRLYIKTLKFDLAVKSQSFHAFLRHENAKQLFSSSRRWFFLRFTRIAKRLVYAPSSFLKLPSFSSGVSREAFAHSLSNLWRVSHNSVAVYLKSYCRLSETQISSKSVNSLGLR